VKTLTAWSLIIDVFLAFANNIYTPYYPVVMKRERNVAEKRGQDIN
jgi:hypothetical protein